MGPPSPEASISGKAPSGGKPSSVLMAGRLPAAAATVAVLALEPIAVQARRRGLYLIAEVA